MSRALRWIGVVVLATLLTADLLVVAALLFVVVESLVGSAADDPHGYSRIFGIVVLLILVPIGLMLLGLLRRLARPIRRVGRARRASSP